MLADFLDNLALASSSERHDSYRQARLHYSVVAYDIVGELAFSVGADPTIHASELRQAESQSIGMGNGEAVAKGAAVVRIPAEITISRGSTRRLSWEKVMK